nr:MAG TPA: hypothetical protein [Caudoviricetes sp.]
MSGLGCPRMYAVSEVSLLIELRQRDTQNHTSKSFQLDVKKKRGTV